MQTETNELEINGITYVRKDSITQNQLPLANNVVLVRCAAAGVFYGNPSATDLSKGLITLKNARRVWYWAGAASLSQLAVDGTSKPKECMFPAPVSEIQLAGVIEVIPMTSRALESLNRVSIWKQ